MIATKRNMSSALLWAACESEIDLRRQTKLSHPTSSAGIDAARANRTASRPHPSNCSKLQTCRRGARVADAPRQVTEGGFAHLAARDSADDLVGLVRVARCRNQVRPLRSTNSTVTRNAQRLLPSGSGWFFIRCQ